MLRVLGKQGKEDFNKFYASWKEYWESKNYPVIWTLEFALEVFKVLLLESIPDQAELYYKLFNDYMSDVTK